ncbi:sulfotransferase family protein, partial [Megalodesulfovibrio gigas]
MLTQPNPLLVLSMHRSGASALAGCLHLLGFNLGPSLKPADENNEQGYWENEDLVLIHEILLRQLGCSWDMIGSQPAGWLESAAGHKARQNLQALLERSFPPGTPWAVKDPLLCPLMPLWTSVLEQRGERPGLIVLVRHPEEVAASLARRDKMDIRKGLLLWLAYNREAFAACRDRPHVVITYDQLLADPIGVLANIEKRLCITFPKTLRETCSSILSLVRTDLKHEHVADRREPVEDNYSYFSTLYEYIRNIGIEVDVAQALSQASQECAVGSLSAKEEIFFQPIATELPLPAKGESIFVSTRERLRKAAPQLFDNLLEHIGVQEREWASHRAACERRILTSSSIGSTLFAEVYFPQPQEPTYSEKHKETFLLVPEVWQELACIIENPVALRRWGLRIDPLNTKGMVSISEIQLINVSTSEPLFRVADPQGFAQLRVEGHGFAISGQEALTLCAVDSDPQIYLSPLDLPDCPLELRIWLKVQTSQEPLQAIWADQQQALAELSAVLEAARREAAGRIQDLEGQLTAQA